MFLMVEAATNVARCESKPTNAMNLVVVFSGYKDCGRPTAQKYVQVSPICGGVFHEAKHLRQAKAGERTDSAGDQFRNKILLCITDAEYQRIREKLEFVTVQSSQSS